jgi:hypothetical protein
VTLVPRQVNPITNYYTLINAVLVADATMGLGIMGPTGTVYEIESRTSLTTGSWLPVSTNMITVNGFISVLPNPGTNGATIFYRAVRLEQ